MRKKIQLLLVISLSIISASAQDSVMVRVHPKYDRVSKLHRYFFGENYRKEWSVNTMLPVLRISEINGGLQPLKMGGGHQTLSLRLMDKSGKEWVLRSVEKDASVMLPVELKETFAKDILDDAMSAQNPFAPLIIPDLAKAAHVPHANPVIGIVGHDTALGDYEKIFAGKACLLEERDPLGKSDNTAEMIDQLNKDNDNNFDSRAFLRTMLLDLLISDWDRHGDQWRWVDFEKGKRKLYVGVPRDRDQALYVNQGVFPGIASKPWVIPNLQGFEADIKHVKYSFLETNFMNARPAIQFNYDEWMRITNEFTKAITDSILEKALEKLPASVYQLRHQKLYQALKQRRDNIPAAMDKYYRFINRIADIQLTNKNEYVGIMDTLGNALHIVVIKKTKQGDLSDTIMSKIYTDAITKEIRIFAGKGDDSIVVDNKASSIRLRIIGGDGNKKYNVINTTKRIKLYEKKKNASFTGDVHQLRKHLSNDSSNTAFVPVNRYNIAMPLIAGAYNLDDGLLLGLGIKYTHQGFRKKPYASVNQLIFTHSFSTSAYRIKYSGEWLKVFGKADMTLNALAFAPNNTQNFFGSGNESEFNKTGNYKKYYRARFSLYQVTPALRWRNNKGIVLSIGPSLQLYTFDSLQNKGRFITNGLPKYSYDSLTFSNSKTHAGIILNFGVDKRNNKILPTGGYYIGIKTHGFAGLNNYSKNFFQIIPEIGFYLKLNASASIVVAERLGAGVSIGKTTFYQSMFIGGHENLLGYRQYRFAGENMLYNNLELRIKLAKFTGYIIPGQFGLIGFYDIGRVWVKNLTSNKWHTGTGGGLYFAPAQMAVLSAVAGYSEEGWYPYITLGFRF